MFPSFQLSDLRSLNVNGIVLMCICQHGKSGLHLCPVQEAAAQTPCPTAALEVLHRPSRPALRCVLLVSLQALALYFVTLLQLLTVGLEFQPVILISGLLAVPHQRLAGFPGRTQQGREAN